MYNKMNKTLNCKVGAFAIFCYEKYNVVHVEQLFQFFICLDKKSLNTHIIISYAI